MLSLAAYRARQVRLPRASMMQPSSQRRRMSQIPYRRGEYEEALDAAQKWNQPEFFWNQVHLAQAHAQLGHKKEAQTAVAKLLELYPEFPNNAWEEFRHWELREDMVELFIDGLRKAGMDIPPEWKRAEVLDAYASRYVTALADLTEVASGSPSGHGRSSESQRPSAAAPLLS